MNVVFLDTVGLIAIWDDRDQWHSAAERAYKRLLDEAAVMVTSEAVLLECGNAASRLKSRPIVAFLRQRLLADSRLLLATPIDVENAWSAYERGGVRSAGIVDQLSFQLMRRHEIQTVFTNDVHFKTAGFVTLF